MGVKLHQGHMNGSRDIQNGLILSGQPLYDEQARYVTDILVLINKNNLALVSILSPAQLYNSISGF
jgi:hypothetical protein